MHQCTARHHVDFIRLRLLRIGIHHARQQGGIKTAPVDADAHRFVVAAGELDQRRELLVAFAAVTDVARIDTQLRQRLGAGRMLLK